jgi:hypothetical protein
VAASRPQAPRWPITKCRWSIKREIERLWPPLRKLSTLVWHLHGRFARWRTGVFGRCATRPQSRSAAEARPSAAGVVTDGVQRAQAVSALAGLVPTVRAGEADPRRLGVHAAISVPGVPDELPPECVPRDADAGGHGVRARVAAAAERGGFVLLVGGSSVGKTRCG